ncbi:MAG: transglycosylase SLT domain-containing protein [Gammaproteobacteria bacterium]
MMRRPSSLTLALLVVLLGACSGRSARHDDAAPASAPTAQAPPAELRAEVDAALTRGRAALYAWRQGDAVASHEGFAAARTRLAAVATQCAQTPGCDMNAVVQAQDTLLAAQARALVGAAHAGAPVASAATLSATSDSPLLTDLPAAAASLRLLNGRDLADIIEVNEAVRAALREWLTWLRPFLLDTWENYQYLRHKMWPSYAEAGLPEALLFAILAKESGGKVHAVSGAGAAGPLQFMPATGQRFGLGKQGDFDTRFDPAAATRANVAYLNAQFALLNHDLELVLAAYNGGEGRMARLSPRGTRRFWDRRVFDHLPRETRTYVPMVLAAAWLFLHPEQYGLEFPAIDARPGSVTLPSTLSLNEVALCLGQSGNPRGWFRTLRNLNPRWDVNQRLPTGTVLELPAAAAAAFATQCTAPAALALVQALQEAEMPGAETPRPGYARTHIVAKGETLSAIANRHGCGVKDIATANSISPPRYAIRIGQRLRVPACRS